MACLAIFDHVRAVTSRLAGSFIHARWCHWLLFPSGPGGPLARVRCSPPRPHDPRRWPAEPWSNGSKTLAG